MPRRNKKKLRTTNCPLNVHFSIEQQYKPKHQNEADTPIYCVTNVIRAVQNIYSGRYGLANKYGSFKTRRLPNCLQMDRRQLRETFSWEFNWPDKWCRYLTHLVPELE